MTVLYQNHQWQVIATKMRTVPGIALYEIDAGRLLEKTNRGSSTYYEWPVHMSEKTWVDVSAFENAFVKALEIHKGRYAGDVDEEMLSASFELARGQANRRR